MNRLMLELGAFRAFHLNQVVEDRAKAQALIDTITDGVLLADDKGQLIYNNQRALSLLGIPKPDGAVITLPAAVRRAELAEALAGMLSQEQDEVRSEVLLPGPDGAEGVARSYMVISRLFHLASLKRPGRVIVLRDITVEKEIESARETFFHMLTHDMRAPLASIQGYAQMLGTKLFWAPALFISRIPRGTMEIAASFHPEYAGSQEAFIAKIEVLRRAGFQANVSMVAYPPLLPDLPQRAAVIKGTGAIETRFFCGSHG